MPETELSKWLVQIQRERFRSPRQFSLRVALDQNAIQRIIDQGRATPETLIQIADGLKVPRVEVFRLAGWLRDEDVEPLRRDALTEDSAELVRLYERVPSWAKPWFRDQTLGLERGLLAMRDALGDEEQMQAMFQEGLPGDRAPESP